MQTQTNDVSNCDELLLNSRKDFLPFREEFDGLDAVLKELAGIVDESHVSKLSSLRSQLSNFSINISLIGQVKAGKTTLANVLSGQPGLLPADVNPWTSVVTTLHLNSTAPRNTRARFQFFNQDEWSALVSRGGRLGELANRADSQEELTEIRRQVKVMQEKAKERLGRNFELLLGQEHRYDHFDNQLLERYVCLGEADASPQAHGKQGRFADLTKTAEIYVEAPQYPVPIALQDTPGVNDPFLVREQITIQSVRGAEICIVVLSAHQALSTMDMALIRIMGNLNGRQLILFINRIDELSDPSNQIPEIESSISSTLKKNNVDTSYAVIFGCAKWGEAALTDSLSDLPEDSKSSLINWAHKAEEYQFDDPRMHTWHLSGIPALLEEIAERSARGSGTRLLEKVRRQALNITNRSRITGLKTAEKLREVYASDIDGRVAIAEIDRITNEYKNALDEICVGLQDGFQTRIQQIEEGFVERSAKSLLSHLEAGNEVTEWSCDPNGLRLKARAEYARFGRRYKSEISTLFAQAADAIEKHYRDVLLELPDNFNVEAPVLSALTPPVVLAGTIAIDMENSWWKRWWKARRGHAAFEAEYRSLISAEVKIIMAGLCEDQAFTVLNDAKRRLSDFFEENRQTIRKVFNRIPDDESRTTETLTDDDNERAHKRLGEVIETLEKLVA